MNPRERLLAAVRGGETDRQPQIAWPGNTADSDAIVRVLDELRSHGTDEARPTLLEVTNPFGLSQLKGTNLNDVLEEDPAVGERLLSELAQEVKHFIEVGIASGAEGFLYRLHGAHPGLSTPMQYGGHYLEVDREILASFEGIPFRSVFVVGGEGAYLDFVSDLPAEMFGWDVRASGVGVQAMRTYRQGALMAASDQADVVLSFPGDISPTLRMESTSTHA